jgi:hypothetical protein
MSYSSKQSWIALNLYTQEMTRRRSVVLLLILGLSSLILDFQDDEARRQRDRAKWSTMTEEIRKLKTKV